MNLRITPYEISVLSINKNGRIYIIPFSVIIERFAQRILERSCRTIGYSNTYCHTTRQLRMGTNVPIVFSITFTTLGSPCTIIRPGKTIQSQELSVVCPVYHVRSRINSPLVHPEEICTRFINISIQIKRILNDQWGRIGSITSWNNWVLCICRSRKHQS